jgi:glycosyltransferase involved in cell wall biosynthesis
VAKRILFVLVSFERNGAVLSTLTTIKYLAQTGYQPELFVLIPGEPWDDLLEGIPVHYGLKPGETFKTHLVQLLSRFGRVARRADVLVGGLEMTPTFLTVLFGKLLGKPSVGFVRNSLPELLKGLPRVYTLLTKLVYPGLTRVVAISSGIQASVEALIPRLRGRVRTIYIPLELGKVQARSLEPLPEGAPREPYLVAVGRLEPQKGFDILLHAYARLRAQGVTLPLVIVGAGRQEESLNALAASLEITPHVHFTGFEANPYPWIKGAQVFVSSSRFEGFCRVIAEALAVGTPVVSTDCPSGPAEVLEQGASGVLVCNEDAFALAEGMAALLADPARQDALRARGPVRAQAFTPEATRAAFVALLQELEPKNRRG